MLNSKNEKLLERINKRIGKEVKNFKEEEFLKIGTLIDFYEEDGEDEAGAGVGNASFYITREKYNLVEKDGRCVFRIVERNGKKFEDKDIYLDEYKIDDLFYYYINKMNW